MDREQQHATVARLRRKKMLPTGDFAENVANGNAALIAPEVDEFQRELAEQLATELLGLRAIAVQWRQQILDNDFTANAVHSAVRQGEPSGQAGRETVRQPPGKH